MALGPAPIALSVRPHDPTLVWVMLRLCIFATIVQSAVGIIASIFEIYAEPYERDANLSAQLWYLWYYYAGYALWPIFFLTLILLMWLTYRLARNLHALAPNKFTLSPTFAIGYYFVPIANIFMPPRVTGLIARDTFAAAEAPNGFNAIIGWWWGSFLLAALLSNASTAIAVNAGAYAPEAVFDGAAYESALWLGAMAWAVSIASCYFMLRVFGPLTRAQAVLVRDWATRQSA